MEKTYPLTIMESNAPYSMTSVKGSYQFHFHCAYCDEGHTIRKIHTESVDMALQLARKEARSYFNGCRKCGKWVCDKHYYIDEYICPVCALAGAEK